MNEKIHDVQYDTLSLLFAMAPIDDVIQSNLSGHVGNQSSDEGLQLQTSFAQAVTEAWHDDFGPSKSYLRKICKAYIETVGEANLQADDLLVLMVEMLSRCAISAIPVPEEHCYLTYRIGSPLIMDPIRIRIFPHHNDVGLRLWEAGSTLAEYIALNPATIQGQRVVELGAGVGLTGIVALAHGASHVACTDYTERSLENMRHNFQMVGSQYENNLEALYLDWTEFHENVTIGDPPSTIPGLAAVANASVLLAADVIYDRSAIPHLAEVVRVFLQSAGSSPKIALFALTMRNANTFKLFEEELVRRGISSEMVQSGDQCDDLPRLFHTYFVQPRSDVRITSLQLSA